MTKRQAKSTESPAYPKVHSASVYVVDREINEDTHLALWEQLYEMKTSPSDIAKSIASELRKESPNREFLDMVARMLDPKADGRFKLVVARRWKGKTWTRRANYAALKKATLKWKRALGNKHGDQKRAVIKTADQFEVSKHTVLKAIRSK
jgi:hypothetical protein